MTIASTDTLFAHNVDTDFRAWGAEWSAGLLAVGLTHTADTGQINWTTVTIPGSGSAGYETWRFNDTLQATKPIFIRFDYGGAVGTPQIWAQIGTGTDGAGNLTGAVSTPLAPINPGSAIFSNLAPYSNYFCYNATVGAFTVAWKLGANGPFSPGFGLCAIGRSCDSTGAPTSSGATIYTGGTNPATAQSISFTVPNIAYAQHQNYGMVIGNVLGSAVGANVQAYLNWAHYPRVEPVNWICSLLSVEFPRGIFNTPLVGATARNYLSLGVNSPNSSPGSNAADTCFGMLYA